MKNLELKSKDLTNHPENGHNGRYSLFPSSTYQLTKEKSQIQYSKMARGIVQVKFKKM